MAPGPWRYLGGLALLAAPLAVHYCGRPADCPCVTWAQDTACGNDNHFGWPTCADYLFDPSPWAWQWIMDANKTGGTCAKCSGTMKDFDCGYVFPCFADGPDIWGHRDIDISNVGCKFQYSNGSAGHQCEEWVPKKGPACQKFVSKDDDVCIKHEEFCIKTRNFVFKDDDVCIKYEEFCIKSEEFCI